MGMMSGSGAAKGGLSGAASGAGIGTMIAPGLGTAIGGVVGGIAGALGGGILGGQEEAAAKAEAERNALLYEQAGAAAEAKGAAEAARIRGATVRATARAKIAMLSQGIGGEGVSDVIRGMALNGQTDAETVKTNAAREAWGYQNQATNARYEGAVAADRNKMSILGGAVDAVEAGARTYANYKKLNP